MICIEIQILCDLIKNVYYHKPVPEISIFPPAPTPKEGHWKSVWEGGIRSQGIQGKYETKLELPEEWHVQAKKNTFCVRDLDIF